MTRRCAARWTWCSVLGFTFLRNGSSHLYLVESGKVEFALHERSLMHLRRAAVVSGRWAPPVVSVSHLQVLRVPRRPVHRRLTVRFAYDTERGSYNSSTHTQANSWTVLKVCRIWNTNNPRKWWTSQGDNFYLNGAELIRYFNGGTSQVKCHFYWNLV